MITLNDWMKLVTTVAGFAALIGFSAAPSVHADPIPSGAHHSSVADVWVPASASLEPAEDTAPGAERWDINTGYMDAVNQEQALLPIGKPLSNGMPWCRVQRHDNDTLGTWTQWLWGGGRDAIVVGVFPVDSNLSWIVVTDFPHFSDRFCCPSPV
jgi:hypothetical protein